MAFSFAKSIPSRRFSSVIVVTHLISGVMLRHRFLFNASKIRFLFKGSTTEPSIPIVDLIRIYILLMQIKSGSQFLLSPVRTTRIFFESSSKRAVWSVPAPMSKKDVILSVD